jgi:gamma-glutamyltranspeptidase / glutathione hydrolase
MTGGKARAVDLRFGKIPLFHKPIVMVHWQKNLVMSAINLSERNVVRGGALLLALLWLALGCRQKAPSVYTIATSAEGDSAMVVTAHPLATATGLRILRAGGNAVDAAVAIQFTLAVVYPAAGNLGGGGFMLIVPPEGEPAALDFRERAPGTAFAGMYLDALGEVIPDASVLGALAAGVPGTVDGMVEAHRRYGRLPWPELLRDAIDHARQGIFLTEIEARFLNERRDLFLQVNRRDTPFTARLTWQEGDRLVQLELAATLVRIRDHGREGFYGRETAAMILEEMQRSGGWISARDLEDYRSVWREPLRGEFRGLEVLTMPPPSSGGLALLQLLGMMELHGGAGSESFGPAVLHRMAEASRRVYADRATWLGDPDFIEFPLRALLDPGYLRGRLADFSPDTVTPSAQVLAGQPAGFESEETTHFSITDQEGWAVAVTTTLNLAYGSKLVVSGAGFLLNNEMDDFSIKPGVPNQFGLVGGSANAIAPGKRMLSSMTPTILRRDGQALLVLGTPGGSTIITTVFQIILRVLDFGSGLEEAVRAPRFHHQWRPDTLWMEPGWPDSVHRGLIRYGHRVVERAPYGRVDAILRGEGGSWQGVADPRGDDHAEGF